MYTVLIQPSDATESFARFAPLFSELINGGDIDVCPWIESGHTIDSALPGLRDLIAYKTEWRALVLCPNPDVAGSAHPSDPCNPFDFLANREDDAFRVDENGFTDSDIPLIRLTHLLGGVPRFEIEYESVELYGDEESGRSPRLGYSAIDAAGVEMKNAILEDWERSQFENFLMPTEIILLKAKDIQAARGDYATAAASWNSSVFDGLPSFSERNSYPAKCRFLTFDFDFRGPARTEASCFRFWLAALLLACNRVQPDYLKAAHLYKIGIDLDLDSLGESFQEVINKLNYAKFTLKRSIAKDEEELAGGNVPVPKFDVGIPVVFEYAPESSFTFNRKRIGLFGGEESTDLRYWREYDKNTDRSVRVMERQIERSLDFAACRVRENALYPEYAVKPLGEYQREDLRLAVSDVYENVIGDQADLPRSFSNVKPELESIGEEIENSIATRPGSRDALVIAGAVGATALVGLLPAAFGRVSLLPGGVYSAALVALSVGAGALVLWKHRQALLAKIRKYHVVIQKLLSEFSQAADRYSHFLSDMTSHMRGSSYLSTMATMRVKKDDSSYAKRKHLAYIESFLVTLAAWAESLHADVDINSVDALEDFLASSRTVDYEDLYVFDARKDFKIPLNDSGVNVESPYGFITQLTIVREGVFEDV